MQERAAERGDAAFDAFDGYIFVTGEYNHSIPGALKNALDYLYKEWNNKAAGFDSYGSAGGTRAVEHLRSVAGELQMADVRAQVALPLATEFEGYRTFTPSESAERNLQTLLDQVIAWAAALKVLRPGAEAGLAGDAHAVLPALPRDGMVRPAGGAFMEGPGRGSVPSSTSG